MSEKITVTIDSDLEELIPGFMENRKKDLETLGKAVTIKDFKTLRSVGHSLKGVGGGYGFDRMSELGASIEEAGKASDLESAREYVEQLRDYLSRLEIVFE
jgi:HPt (histidine-containing phosphotransfer) domain-containing protein